MRTVVLIAAGGTIASTADAFGVKSAGLSGDQLLSSVPTPPGVHVRVVDAGTVNSYAMGFGDMDRVHAAVRNAMADPNTCGVVITHGTDTLEETAMLLDLFHHDARPVVMTGAQRSWDDPETDAVDNLQDALITAASTSARSLGVLLTFGGVIHAAAGTRKAHNSALAAFVDADNGPLGLIADGMVRVHTKIRRPQRMLPEVVKLAHTRVDTVAIYPGVDRIAIDAYIAAGARGLVLQATGYGNANADVVAAVADHCDVGIPVVLSTRVAGGPTRAVYGAGGGGVDLVRAGAIPSGYLRPSQSRILLAALLVSGASSDQIRTEFTGEIDRYADAADLPASAGLSCLRNSR